jgi:SAM-dependent methyltransferase
VEPARPSTLRLAALYDFARSHLPPPPARVLEIGCGDGELAEALAHAGYSLTAIDPDAPTGAIFRRVTLEDFSDEGRFDAVVASVSLHHLPRLDAAMRKIESLLDPGGVLVVEEFAKERFSGPTARWYHQQRRAFDALGLDADPVSDDFETWLEDWIEGHADIHVFAEVRAEIAAHFAERAFEWVPFLYDYRLDDALEPIERKLIETGAIDATGARYVGELTA